MEKKHSTNSSLYFFSSKSNNPTVSWFSFLRHSNVPNGGIWNEIFTLSSRRVCSVEERRRMSSQATLFRKNWEWKHWCSFGDGWLVGTPGDDSWCWYVYVTHVVKLAFTTRTFYGCGIEMRVILLPASVYMSEEENWKPWFDSFLWQVCWSKHVTAFR